MQETQEMQVQSLGQEDSLEDKMATTPVFLSGRSHGQRSLIDYGPWGCRVWRNWAHTHIHTQSHTYTHFQLYPQHKSLLNNCLLLYKLLSWNVFTQIFFCPNSKTVLLDETNSAVPTHNELESSKEIFCIYKLKTWAKGSPGGSVAKSSPANAGDMGSSLIWKDPTYCWATKPMSHNYWACTLEPRSSNYWAHVCSSWSWHTLEPMLCDKRSHCSEKPAHHN